MTLPFDLLDSPDGFDFSLTVIPAFDGRQPPAIRVRLRAGAEYGLHGEIDQAVDVVAADVPRYLADLMRVMGVEGVVMGTSASLNDVVSAKTHALQALDAELAEEERAFAERVAGLRARRRSVAVELRVAEQAMLRLTKLLGNAGDAVAQFAGAVETSKASAGNRGRVVALLKERRAPMTTGEIMRALGLSNPTVTAHLGSLRKFGTVERVRRGLWRITR